MNDPTAAPTTGAAVGLARGVRMDDERWARLEAKREQNRYFMKLEVEALESQKNPPKAPKKPKAPKPRETAEVKLSACRGCARQMSHGLTPEPGTVRHTAKGYCRNCYVAAQRRRAKKRTRKDARPVTCKGCDVILRDAKDPIRPGTALHFGKGLCDTCGRRKRAYQRNCVDCGIAMRPNGSKLADWPGTIQHFAHGRCQRCDQGNQARDRRLASGETKCAQCSIVIRSSARAAADYDVPTRRAGKRREDGSYLCTVCEYAPKKRPPLTPCIDCHVELVPRTQDPGPGQKRHAGGNRCSTCKTRARKKALAG